MNAYELADELLRENTQVSVESAYMLRQQAKRIEELEEHNKKLQWALAKSTNIMGDSSHKELSDEAISDIADEVDKKYATHPEWIFFFAKAIIKASRGEE